VADEGLVTTKMSPWSVTDTVAQLLASLEARGSTTYAVIDLRDEAAEAAVELPQTTLVMFGEPETWRLTVYAAPLVALELPLKVLVWADGDTTMISYDAPAAIARRNHLDDAEVEDVFGIVDAVTDAVIAL
jgi:uncharacterized protein (DUF302 family)